MMDAKKKLLKDRINKTNNVALAKELIHAIEAGEDVLTELLQKAGIAVFCFKEEEGKEYRICRL